ncbi:MAG: cobalamin transport system substrate-binding protein [Pseudomonadota bacterium]|nr:cobalamin transport system substrate-binding protein [Pseudomonadota bacterium]
MRLVRRWLLALLLLLALGPAQADRWGAASAVPRRIVSLMPSLTETVCALEACDRLVGVDRYSNWPAAVGRLPHLGGMDDPQIERIVALRPDLVLAAPSSRAVGRLQALGLRVVVLESRTSEEARRTAEALAVLLGQPGQGAALWARIDAQVQRAVARVPAAWQGRRVYFEVDAAPYAAGRSSFIGELLQRFGLVNIVPAQLGPFPKINPEFIVRAAPDVVMAIDRNIAEMPTRPGWSTLKALQAGRACAFTASGYDTLVRPGPRLGDAAELVADCLGALR